jgi:hypothetical protein
MQWSSDFIKMSISADVCDKNPLEGAQLSCIQNERYHLKKKHKRIELVKGIFFTAL